MGLSSLNRQKIKNGLNKFGSFGAFLKILSNCVEPLFKYKLSSNRDPNTASTRASSTPQASGSSTATEPISMDRVAVCLSAASKSIPNIKVVKNVRKNCADSYERRKACDRNGVLFPKQKYRGLCTVRLPSGRNGGRPSVGCNCVTPDGTAVPLCRTPQKYKDKGHRFKSCHTLFHEDVEFRKNEEYQSSKQRFTEAARKHDDMENIVKKLKLSLSAGSSA
eukprot:Nk52_evm1s1193 gene=Nk52_evmTU1s1193